MKKVVLACLLIVSMQAMADCNDSYRFFHVKKSKKGTIFSSAGVASPIVGTGLYSVAWEIGSSIGVSAAQKLLVVTSLGMTIAAPVTTVVGLISFAQAADYQWVKKILDQSQVEMGGELENLSERMSEKLEREVSVEEFSTVVNEANSNDLFCLDKLYNSFQFKKYVESELN